MFWGLIIEPGKRYSTTVEKSFHVSKATLDCSSVKNDQEILSVMLETEGSESLLCNLCKQKGILQETLDLNFMTGDRVTFECKGHGRIHLSGYLLPDEEDDLSGMMGDEEESEEEEEEEDTPGWSTSSSPDKQKKEKRKGDASSNVPAKKKKIAVEEEDGDSESDQDDESDLSEEMDEDLEGEDEDDETNDKDEEDDSEDEGETIPSPKEKQQKQDKPKTPNKQNLNTSKKTPVANGVTPKDQKNKKSPAGEKTPNANTTPKQKQVLDHGVVVKEIRVGNGAPAKPGKSVTVYYVGKLKEGGKVFDKSMKGEGFKFKLGKGEVIKGWDVGVQGMKVGGKRVIHCPPEAAYGAKGVPPKIPPNSTLTFEVELKNVN